MITSDVADNPLLAELRAVHGMLRRDLQVCRDLADAAAAGQPVDELRDRLSELTTAGPLFRLKANCLGFCLLVHRHHTAEDEQLFPVVRHTAPHLAAEVDRLVADHRRVAVLLHRVESAADGLAEDVARHRLVGALRDLSEHLLDHLDFEEQTLGPVFASWPRWPPR